MSEYRLHLGRLLVSRLLRLRLDEGKKIQAGPFRETAQLFDFRHGFVDLPFGGRRISVPRPRRQPLHPAGDSQG